MKYLKLYEQFLTSGVEQINEAADPVKTQDKVRSFLEKEGYEVSGSGATLEVKLPNRTKVIPPKMQKDINKIIKLAKNGDMMAVKTNVGYYMGNSVRFIFSVNQASLRKAYHVAAAADVESILANGLEPRNAAAHSDQFGSSAGDSDTTQTYKAAFVVGSKQGVKMVQDLFAIKDPVVLEIDPKGLNFFEDPLMRPEAKSAVTYETIPADRIKRA